MRWCTTHSFLPTFTLHLPLRTTYWFIIAPRATITVIDTFAFCSRTQPVFVPRTVVLFWPIPSCIIMVMFAIILPATNIAVTATALTGRMTIATFVDRVVIVGLVMLAWVSTSIALIMNTLIVICMVIATIPFAMLLNDGSKAIQESKEQTSEESLPGGKDINHKEQARAYQNSTQQEYEPTIQRKPLKNFAPRHGYPSDTVLVRRASSAACMLSGEEEVSLTQN